MGICAQELFHTGLQNRADFILQKGLHLLSSSLCALQCQPNSTLTGAKFQKICKVSATASHSGLGGPTKAPRAYFPHPSSLPPSLSPFSLELLEMPPESSFSNRISRICPSLSEIGGQKPQEWSCVIFLLSTWQFFSNIHPDMSEGSEWAVFLVRLYYVSMNLLLGPFFLIECVLNLLCLGKTRRSCD